MRLILLFISLVSSASFAKGDLSQFKARLFSVNKEVSLLKFRSDFSNAKFLTPGARAKFRTNIGLNHFCDGVVLSKSVNHFLFKVTHMDKCAKYQNLSLGINADFVSIDLEKNMISVNDLVKVLNKKRLAIFGKLQRVKKRLAIFVERVDATNKRFDTLRTKLEAERQEALSYLESEKLLDTQNFKNYSSKLDEIDFKLEKYRLEDSNSNDIRWSLDYSETNLQ